MEQGDSSMEFSVQARFQARIHARYEQGLGKGSG